MVEDVLVGLREVVRAEVVVVDVLLAVLDRLKVTLLLLDGFPSASFEFPALDYRSRWSLLIG